MIQLDDKIISLDIFKTYFLCDLKSCKGACCVEGDAGAPITIEEKKIIEEALEHVKPYMSFKGIKSVEVNGVAVLDDENDLTTTLVNNRECAFSYKDKGIVRCSFESACNDGKIKFKKPISCHLFPIRITSYEDFEAINYEKIQICKSACACGTEIKLPLYVFLREPLIRKYGKNWYDELVKIGKAIKKA